MLAGRADGSEYVLKGQTSVIGSVQSAVVQLRGWFKPKVAAVIARRGQDYVLTPVAGKCEVNGQPTKALRQLHDGDVLSISGLSLQFTLTR